MADAFGTKFRIDDIDIDTLGNGAIGTFRFAHVAVDTFISNE